MNSDLITAETINEIYKKTFAYELERIRINEDGSTTHLHSDRFLDEHPERRNSPEFTEEEEKDQGSFSQNRTTKDE
jgi:hypothetical protein